MDEEARPAAVDASTRMVEVPTAQTKPTQDEDLGAIEALKMTVQGAQQLTAEERRNRGLEWAFTAKGQGPAPPARTAEGDRVYLERDDVARGGPLRQITYSALADDVPVIRETTEHGKEGLSVTV